MKLTILILLLFLVACKGETITCTNTTIIKEVAVIKEVKIPCVCADCPELPEEKVCPRLDEATVSRKLNLCNIRYDELNKEMFKCLLQNNTAFMENLTMEYNNCVRDRDNCEDIISNISGWIK